NFTIEGGHNFDLTITGFNPLFHSESFTPASWQLGLFNGTPHDVLNLTFDSSSGITSLAHAAAHESVEQIGQDVLLHIDTSSVQGTITFHNLANLVPDGQTEFFSWVNHVGAATQVV